MSTETINLTHSVYEYLLNKSLREPDVLKKLREETHTLSSYVMQISPEQGQFMALLMELLGAKKTLDIGTFTGYSALVVALAGLFVPIPFMALEILLGLIQAYIFTVLATVFIGAACGDGERA